MTREERIKIVINNYFKKECSVDTSIREAFEKGFRIGVSKVQKKHGRWIEVYDDRISGRCSACGWEAHMYEDDVVGMSFCPNCGADMRTEVQGDSFFNDDITFCSYDRCTMKKCERHMSQIRDKSIPHSFANFEGCAWWPQKVVKNNEREIK